MSEKITISGESRQETGKSNSRSLRSSEIVPGVIYGEEKSSNIKVLEKDLKKILENPSIFSQVIDLNIDGSPFEVLLKDIQRNPRNDRPSHVDFLVVSKDTKVTVNVPLKFINEDICVGVKQQGGMISHLRNEVEVLCSAASLPEFIEIDAQNIELNQSVMMSEISLPEGVELTSVLNDLQDQPVLSCAVTRASLEIDDDPVIGEDGEEVTDDAEASADSSQTDESQEEESNDN
jgi:large subunit ribosomal protein L25